MNTQLVSKYLQLLRKEYHYTQEDLARELHISRQAISKWETGNTIPDLETLLKISKLYHLSINDILEPNIPANIIKDFEQITEVPETKVKSILSSFTANDIAKAAMGASPTVNAFLAKVFPHMDFKGLQSEIGQIKIAEVEDVQTQIVAMINLEIATT